MSLPAATAAILAHLAAVRAAGFAVGRVSDGLVAARAAFDPNAVVTVGAGSDRAAEIYTSIFTRRTPSVGSFNRIEAEVARRRSTRDTTAIAPTQTPTALIGG